MAVVRSSNWSQSVRLKKAKSRRSESAFLTTDVTDIRDDWMLGNQRTIRAIRVICVENGLQDWPQRGAEGTKRRRRLKPLISAHRRSSRTAECPRNTRNTRKAEPGRLAAKRRKKGERRSDFFTEFTEPCHRGRRRLKAKTAKCRERSVNPRNPRETLGRLLRIIFLPTKSA